MANCIYSGHEEEFNCKKDSLNLIDGAWHIQESDGWIADIYPPDNHHTSWRVYSGNDSCKCKNMKGCLIWLKAHKPHVNKRDVTVIKQKESIEEDIRKLTEFAGKEEHFNCQRNSLIKCTDAWEITGNGGWIYDIYAPNEETPYWHVVKGHISPKFDCVFDCLKWIQAMEASSIPIANNEVLKKEIVELKNELEKNLVSKTVKRLTAENEALVSNRDNLGAEVVSKDTTIRIQDQQIRSFEERIKELEALITKMSANSDHRMDQIDRLEGKISIYERMLTVIERLI